MFQEHDRNVLTKDLATARLKGGDVGTIVHTHRDREAFEVELLALGRQCGGSGNGAGSRLRPVAATRSETHGRVLKRAGKTPETNGLPLEAHP